MENEKIYCADCGVEINTDTEEFYNDNSERICENCSENYVTCERCGELIHLDNAYYSDTDNSYYCENCSFYCEDCHDYFNINDSHIEDADGRIICESCAEHYYECDECHRYYHEDYMNFGDNYCYCNNCQNKGVMSYHSFNNWQCKKLEEEKEPKWYIGTELEIDKGYEQKKACDIIYNDLQSIAEHDGSLSYDGIEIISHPLSFKYIMKNKDVYKKAFDKLQKLGYRSHDTSCCGLHIHVTRPSDDTINKIIFIMETYREELEKFSRRRSNGYSRFYSDSDIKFNKDYLKSIEKIKEVKQKLSSDRYYALNLTNNKTIEFRLFKGTLKFETYLASIELVNNIMRLCSSDIPLSEITWDELIKGKYAKNYCELRGIYSNKIPKDMTEQVLKQEVLMIKQKEKLINLVMKCFKRAFKMVIENEYDDNITNRNINNALNIKNYILHYKDNFEDLKNACINYQDILRKYLNDKEYNSLSKILNVGGEQ